MIDAFRSEWVRLLRVRTVLAVGLPLALFPALITVFDFAAGTGNPGPGPASHLTVGLSDLTAADGYLVGIDSAATVIGVIVMVFVAVTFGADYTHGTLRNLLVRQPRRTRLLTGRLLALLTFTAGGIVLSVTAAVAAAWVAAASYDVSTDAWAAVVPETIASWAAVIVASIGWGAAGAALAILLRSTPAAVAAGAVWALPVESSLSAAWDSADRWLPGAVFDAVASQGTDARALTTAAALAAVYAAIAHAGATRVFNRRDVLA